MLFQLAQNHSVTWILITKQGTYLFDGYHFCKAVPSIVIRHFFPRGNTSWNYWPATCWKNRIFFLEWAILSKIFPFLCYFSHSPCPFQEENRIYTGYSNKFGTFWVVHCNWLCGFSKYKVNTSMLRGYEFILVSSTYWLPTITITTRGSCDLCLL